MREETKENKALEAVVSSHLMEENEAKEEEMGGRRKDEVEYLDFQSLESGHFSFLLLSL